MTQRITHIEEIELCKKAQAGNKRAKEKMIIHNMGLVHKLAHKMYFNNQQFSYEDLCQEGVFGLTRAIEKFDSKKGCRFSTYAYNWIKSFIGRYNDNHRGSVRIPSHLITKLRTLDKDSEEYKELFDSLPKVVSMNASIGESSTIEDVIADIKPDNYVEMQIIQDQMRSVLTGREYEILSHRYGLDNNTPKTQREIGKIYEVSYAAIYLIEKKAINKLKLHFA